MADDKKDGFFVMLRVSGGRPFPMMRAGEVALFYSRAAAEEMARRIQKDFEIFKWGVSSNEESRTKDFSVPAKRRTTDWGICPNCGGLLIPIYQKWGVSDLTVGYACAHCISKKPLRIPIAFKEKGGLDKKS